MSEVPLCQHVRHVCTPFVVLRSRVHYTAGVLVQGYLAYKTPPPVGLYSRTKPRALWWS